jgi:FkbM family methyltransferase
MGPSKTMKQFAKSVIPKTVWRKLSRMRNEAGAAIHQGGLGALLILLTSPLLDQLSRILPARSEWVRRLRMRGYQFPIYYRVRTSDLEVIRQVLIRCEYECVAQEPDVTLIIDCGANIGCASFFFLHRYPNARVIAVEPDPGNFAMCRRNLEPFGDRVVLVNSAVWPVAMPLCVARGSYRDGRAWTFQVRPRSEGETSELMGATIADLIERSGTDKIDLLKIDIECAEIPLFSRNTEDWLPRTRCMVIELHGDDCERVFSETMAEYRPEIEKSGELTICRNIRAPDAVTSGIAAP